MKFKELKIVLSVGNFIYNNKYWIQISFLGICHLIINGIGISYLYGRFSQNNMQLDTALLIYNILAYCFQPFLGLYIDIKGKAKLLLSSSLFLASITAFVPLPLWVAGAIFGLTDAVVIISCASMIVKKGNVKLLALGIFAGFGTLGVGIGTVFSLSIYVFAVIGLILALLVFLLRNKIDIRYQEKNAKWDLEINYSLKYFLLPITFLMIAVFFRGYAKQISPSLFSRTSLDSFLIYAFLAVGSIASGFFAKSIGINKTILILYLPSSILLAFFRDIKFAYFMGSLLFNIAVPITLFLMVSYLSEFKTFAFGLISGILLLGKYTQVLLSNNAYNILIFFCVILSSFLIIYSNQKIRIKKL